MYQLLAIEWLKIKKYKTFWVLAGLFLLLLPLWNYEIAAGIIKMGGNEKNGINFLSTAYSFPEVWENIGFWASLFINFLAILVIIITTNEYTYRTNRQNVIDGWKRIQFLNAKAILIVIFSIAATGYFFVLGAVFGRQYSGNFRDIFMSFKEVGYFLVLSLDYMGFALLLAILIRRSGLAIGLFLLYSLVIENILKFIINHYATQPYGNLLMLQSADELLPFPLMKMAKVMMPAAVASSISLEVCTIAACCWCAIYYFICRAILLRRDW